MTLAKLHVLGQEIELLWCDMSYARGTKPNGKTSTEVLGGHITMAFESGEYNDTILRWMTKESLDDSGREIDKMEKGEVAFYAEGFENSPTRRYKFDDAFLIYFSEVFNATGEDPLLTMITISPAIQNYGKELVKPWNIHWIPPSEKMPYQSTPDTSKRITAIYYEDENGKRVDKLLVGTVVYLVIESANITGQAVNINLADKLNDFIHNGEHLEDDMLRDVTISGSIHKEKLTIIAQHHGEPSKEESPEQEEQTPPPTPQAPQSGDKELLEYFLTDEGGKKIEEYEVGDKIVLNIKTKNRIGDKVTIHLEDRTHDFKYNGEVLEDDKLSDFTITKDTEKIELEVIGQLA